MYGESECIINPIDYSLYFILLFSLPLLYQNIRLEKMYILFY